VTVLTDPRRLAYDLLLRIERDHSYANLVLPRALSKSGLAQADRGLVQELVYGVIRWQYSYRQIAAKLSNRDLELEVEIIISLGLHQLFRMRVAEHAALHATVELAKAIRPKAASLVNAVLRQAQREGVDALLKAKPGTTIYEQLALRHSHPGWVISQLSAALEHAGKGAELELLLEANNETPIVNLVALPNTEAAAQLEAAGYRRGEVSPIGFLATGLLDQALAIEGVRVQDQGSQLVTLALLASAPHRGQWADVCAGPGGKAALLAAGLSGTAAKLSCFEVNDHRAALVRKAVEGYPAVSVEIADARELEPASFDAILLDAPCSSLGSVRRKPETRWRKSAAELAGLSKLQQELLAASIRALKPGGVLAYVTCSPLLVETNAIIATALEQTGDSIELLNANQVLNQIAPALELDTDRKTAQLWTHRHHTDSMYLALIRKVG